MEALLIFMVWFIIGLFVGTFLAKRKFYSRQWTVADHVYWCWDFLRGRVRQ